MQRIINFLLGSVLVEVSGSYPERFFNLCGRNGIRFWGMENISVGVFRIVLPISSFRRIRPVARKSMCRIRIVEKRGLPFYTYRFRRRGALVAGCVAFCAIAWVFTSFVWVIEINGFSGLDSAKLISLLGDCGVKKGAFVPAIERSSIQNDILMNMQELAYVSVNFKGSHAIVTVKKRVMPPEILPEDVACDIIADKDGIINDITVKAGTAEVSRGDTVIKGQILASGYITGREGTTILTHADAIINARTWRKLSARILKKQSEKEYTGREKDLYTIIFFGKRIKLYINSGISYMKCDKIIKRTELSLPDGTRLPIALEKATCREYELREIVLTDETAFDMLSEGLHGALKLPDGAEVMNVDFKTSSDSAFAYASLTAECIEPIGIKKEVLGNG